MCLSSFYACIHFILQEAYSAYLLCSVFCVLFICTAVESFHKNKETRRSYSGTDDRILLTEVVLTRTDKL
jgi:hypothetical protein